LTIGAINVSATTPNEHAGGEMDEHQDNQQDDHQDDVVAEDLIEEVSIDGMCGVY
jgi:mycofactocin precursor